MAHRWKFGLLSRLPAHYQKQRIELAKQSTPVHYIPETVNFKRNNETGQIFRIENVKIPTLKSKAMDRGIWGGEEIIKGFRKPGDYRRVPSFWIPSLKKSIVYSEIFDQYLSVVVTERTLKLIDENCGFDTYILRTPIQDLKSQLALDLRRKMLLALIRKELYKDNPDKQSKILKKYQDCLIPEEEAEWFGLSLREACKKQVQLETALNKPVPLKIKFRQELLEQLKVEKESGNFDEVEKTSWLDKFNPLSKKEAF